MTMTILGNTKIERGYRSIYNEEKSWAFELQQFDHLYIDKEHSDQWQRSILKERASSAVEPTQSFTKQCINRPYKSQEVEAQGIFGEFAVGQTMLQQLCPPLFHFLDVVHDQT